MNPFDLPGPQFLLFYAILSVVLIWAARAFRMHVEGGPAPKIDLNPYAIAYLRGGIAEAVQVATVWLVDRSLLSAKNTTLKSAEHATPEFVSEPIEKWILSSAHLPVSAPSLLTNPPGDSVSAPLVATLERHGLLPNSDLVEKRHLIFTAAFSTLLCTTSLKVIIAFSRGKTNVLYLVWMTVCATLLLRSVCFPRLSAKGAAMLEDLQILYGRLRDRAQGFRTGGVDPDVLMLSAVFGIGLLPASKFAFATELYPRAASNGSSGGDSSSSSGFWESSGGSSCGGGDGGGCGGCGGD